MNMIKLCRRLWRNEPAATLPQIHIVADVLSPEEINRLFEQVNQSFDAKHISGK